MTYNRPMNPGGTDQVTAQSNTEVCLQLRDKHSEARSTELEGTFSFNKNHLTLQDEKC